MMLWIQLCVLIGVVCGDHLAPIPLPNQKHEDELVKPNHDQEHELKLRLMNLKPGLNCGTAVHHNKAESSPPDACDSNLVLDAVASLRGERLYFKGSYFWRDITQVNEFEQYPINIFWAEIPDNIDAAFEDTSDDLIYMFKGQKVWVVRVLDIEDTVSLSSFDLPDEVKNIDAALYDETTGKALLFVGNSFYSYDMANKEMDQGYPKPVQASFPGVRGKVTAAFQDSGDTYLFSGPKVFQFNNGRLVKELETGDFLHC